MSPITNDRQLARRRGHLELLGRERDQPDQQLRTKPVPPRTAMPAASTSSRGCRLPKPEAHVWVQARSALPAVQLERDVRYDQNPIGARQLQTGAPP